ncbi:MAG: DEAD/DEAH box helicase [Nitrospira sp.]|nr:DEAD/DEAH box helicase [bacterium]MBL7048286.1 DEAD/DEAH box helicase [Nitrospira sp.]
MSSFDDFNLLVSLKETLSDKGLVKPTEIQKLTLPKLLDGFSVAGVAETGSGKTLAYALPILHALKTLEHEGHPVNIAKQPRAIVIVPTRELGEQVAKVFKIFTHKTRLRVRSALGGTTMEESKRNIAGPFEVLVATPGSILKLLDRGLSLSDVRIFVFDEADQMLDPGFLPNANTIRKVCPADLQMALFSATISPVVQQLMKTLFSGVKVIKSKGSHRIVPTLTTRNETVILGKRFPLLETILQKGIKGGMLIFTNTREQCDKLAAQLWEKNHKCAIFRGEMDKKERRANLKKFREKQIDILISTDLASRGLDLEHVECVINYHLPQEIENYIHRVGRTARAGRPGLVVNFVTNRDKKLINSLDTLKAT